MKVILSMALVALSFGAPAWAQGTALIIGNEDYRSVVDLRRGDELTNVGRALSQGGL